MLFVVVFTSSVFIQKLSLEVYYGNVTLMLVCVCVCVCSVAYRACLCNIRESQSMIIMAFMCLSVMCGSECVIMFQMLCRTWWWSFTFTGM